MSGRPKVWNKELPGTIFCWRWQLLHSRVRWDRCSCRQRWNLRPSLLHHWRHCRRAWVQVSLWLQRWKTLTVCQRRCIQGVTYNTCTSTDNGGQNWCYTASGWGNCRQSCLGDQKENGKPLIWEKTILSFQVSSLRQQNWQSESNINMLSVSPQLIVKNYFCFSFCTFCNDQPIVHFFLAK